MCGGPIPIDQSFIQSRLSEMLSGQARASMEKAEAEFAAMVERGDIFFRTPIPIRIEDIAYG